MRFGAAVLAVVLASAVGSLPAAVRIGGSLSSGSNLLSVWVAFSAAVLLPMAIATIVLRQAHAALRLFDPRAVSNGLVVALVWALTSFGVLLVLGAFLRATTHHHGLAGATFGTVGLVASLLIALLAMRVVAWARSVWAPVRWLLLVLGGLGLGAELASITRTLALSPAASTWCADVLALVLAAAFGALAFPARRRPLAPLAVAGPPLAAVVLVLGFAALRSTPQLTLALEDESPLLSSTLCQLIGRPVPAKAVAPSH